MKTETKNRAVNKKHMPSPVLFVIQSWEPPAVYVWFPFPFSFPTHIKQWEREGKNQTKGDSRSQDWITKRWRRGLF